MYFELELKYSMYMSPVGISLFLFNSIKHNVFRKMTQGEKDRKRLEMMENARWRDEQRETNIKRYQTEEKKEAEMMAKNSGKSEEFLK